MSWTAPRTWASNEVITAAMMNTHVRDNELETAPAKVTTAGDMVYATAAHTLTRMGIGGTGSILVVIGGVPVWGAIGVTGALLTVSGGLPQWYGPGSNGALLQTAAGVPSWLNPGGALRMPRMNASNNLLEYAAGLNLAQAPVFVSADLINSGTSATNIVTQSFTTHGGLVLILATGHIIEQKSAGAVSSHLFDLVRDAAVLNTKLIQSDIGAAGYAADTATFVYGETPAAATYTYKVRGQYSNLSTTGTPLASAALLLIELAP